MSVQGSFSSQLLYNINANFNSLKANATLPCSKIRLFYGIHCNMKIISACPALQKIYVCLSEMFTKFNTSSLAC